MISLGLWANPHHRRLLRPTDYCAVLAGFGAALLALGAVQSFRDMFDVSPSTGRMVISLIMAALALGVYAPHRFALWFADRLWKRFWTGMRRSGGQAAALNQGDDRPFQGTMLAGMAMLCGAASLGGMALIQLMRNAYFWLLEEFLIGSTTLLVIEWLLAAVVVGLLFVPLGATWNCIHHLAVRPGAWGVRPMAGGLAGMGIALGLAALLRADFPAGLLFMTGSLGFFALAILTVRIMPSPITSALRGYDRRRAAPRRAERWTKLIGAAVVISFASSVAGATIWTRLFGVMSGGWVAGMRVPLVMWCFGMASGVVLAKVRRERARSAMGPLGWAFLWPGLATAGGVGLLQLTAEMGMGFGASMLGWLAWAAVLVGVPAVFTGRAVAEGTRAFLARSEEASHAGTGLMTSLLLAGGLVVLTFSGPVVALLGSLAALAVAVFGSAGAAGALVALDPASLPGIRLKRTGAVLGAIAALALTLSQAGSQWMATRPWKRVALEEGGWLIQSVWAVRGEIVRLTEPPVVDALVHVLAEPAAPGDGAEGSRLIDWRRFPRSAKMAVVGRLPTAALADAEHLGHVWDQYTIDPSAAPTAAMWSGQVAASGERQVESAHRFLRRTHRRYDLLVIAAGDLPAEVRHGPAWLNLLKQTLRRTCDDGVVLVIAPAAGYSRAALAEDLRRLERETELRFVWRSATIASERCLALGFGLGNGWRERWTSWTGGEFNPADGLTAYLHEQIPPARSSQTDASRGIVSRLDGF